MATEKEVFELYELTFKPIYADLIVVLGNKPQEVLFELEACLSHLGVAKNDQDDDVIQKNINSAHGHIQRAALDSVKLLWLTLRERSEKIISNENLRRYCVNCPEGDLLNLFNAAESKALEARKKETQNTGRNPNQSITDWYEAASTLQELLKKVDYTKIDSFKKFNLIYIVKTQWIGFLLGLLASAIVSFVFWILPSHQSIEDAKKEASPNTVIASKPAIAASSASATTHKQQ